MIKINLLGIAKAKGKRGGAASVPVMEVGDVGSPRVKALIVIGLVGVLNFSYWHQLDTHKKAIDAKMQVAERKNHELADVKARYLDRQKQADAYKRRVDVIDQLRANQSGPVSLMAMMGDTVNGTEAVWLDTMKDQGNSVDIEGMALSTDAVANLIGNLQKTGYFHNIEIKETYQEPSLKDMQAFQFTLSCEKGKS
jgi:Tfp pilus assembly protein PilN